MQKTNIARGIDVGQAALPANEKNGMPLRHLGFSIVYAGKWVWEVSWPPRRMSEEIGMTTVILRMIICIICTERVLLDGNFRLNRFSSAKTYSLFQHPLLILIILASLTTESRGSLAEFLNC